MTDTPGRRVEGRRKLGVRLGVLSNRRAAVEEHLRIDVGAIGPDYRAEDGIHADGGEERSVGSQRLEDRTVEIRRYVHDALRAVRQAQPQPEAIERLRRSYPYHEVKLIQASDSVEGKTLACPIPVGSELRAMKLAPFPNEARGAWREPPFEHFRSFQIDHGFASGVGGVEVGRRMVVVEHRDHDPMELTDARHLARVRAGTASLGPIR